VNHSPDPWQDPILRGLLAILAREWSPTALGIVADRLDELGDADPAHACRWLAEWGFQPGFQQVHSYNKTRKSSPIREFYFWCPSYGDFPEEADPKPPKTRGKHYFLPAEVYVAAHRTCRPNHPVWSVTTHNSEFPTLPGAIEFVARGLDGLRRLTTLPYRPYERLNQTDENKPTKKGTRR
jgi:hypothetical protein